MRTRGRRVFFTTRAIRITSYNDTHGLHCIETAMRMGQDSYSFMNLIQNYTIEISVGLRGDGQDWFLLKHCHKAPATHPIQIHFLGPKFEFERKFRDFNVTRRGLVASWNKWLGRFEKITLANEVVLVSIIIASFEFQSRYFITKRPQKFMCRYCTNSKNCIDNCTLEHNRKRASPRVPHCLRHTMKMWIIMIISWKEN